MPISRVLIHLVIASVVYAMALAVIVLLFPGHAAASLGEGVSFLEAASFTAMLLLSSGAVSMGAILTPIALLLRRLGLARYPFIVLTGAVAGSLPLVGLTWGPQGFAQGLEDGNWLPEPMLFFAFAGTCGGIYLWTTWFRHLTPNSRGTR